MGQRVWGQVVGYGEGVRVTVAGMGFCGRDGGMGLWEGRGS